MFLLKTKLVTALVSIILLTGCGGSASYSPDFDLGVIQTTGSRNKSIIDFYRDDYTKVGSMTLPFGSMDYHGFIEPIIREDHLFVIPQGLYDKKDLGIVLDIDLTDGTNKQIKFDRINITSAVVTEDYVYAASNLNQIVYLDRYDRKTQKIDTVTLAGWMLHNVEAHNGKLVGAGLDMSDVTTPKVSMFEFDFAAGSYKELADLTPYAFDSEPPIHIRSQGSKIYMTSNDQLLVYDDLSKTIQAEMLPDGMARQMLIEGDEMFILHADIVGGSRESSLTIMNLSDQTLKNYPLGETIWQLVKAGDTISGLDLTDKAIHRYELNDKGITKISSFALIGETALNFSAIFLK